MYTYILDLLKQSGVIFCTVISSRGDSIIWLLTVDFIKYYCHYISYTTILTYSCLSYGFKSPLCSVAWSFIYRCILFRVWLIKYRTYIQYTSIVSHISTPGGWLLLLTHGGSHCKLNIWEVIEIPGNWGWSKFFEDISTIST